MNLDIEDTVKKLLDNIRMNKYSCIVELVKLCEDIRRCTDEKTFKELPHYRLALDAITHLSLDLTK